MLWVAIIGLVMTVAAVAMAGRRALFLVKLATVGPPAPERIAYAKANPGKVTYGSPGTGSTL